MKLTVNGMVSAVPDGATVAAVVADVAGPDRVRGVAVAVNGDVVPRSTWSSTALVDGDRVEILTAVQGG